MGETFDVPAWVLAIIRCPRCGGCLSGDASSIVCLRGHTYFSSADVILFAPPGSGDKYEEEEYVELYSFYANGYVLNDHGKRLGAGHSEGLYRTVTELIFREMLSRSLSTPVIIEFGCGVGRILREVASVVADARVLGFDYSLTMARYASRVCSGSSVRIGSDDSGHRVIEKSWPKLSNVWVAQADASRAPLASGSRECEADLVVLNMLIDRINSHGDVLAAIASACKVLRSGGLLLITSPFNWTSVDCWNYFGDSRVWLLNFLSGQRFLIETAFDGLGYRERLDPFGAMLDLTVAVVTARKI